jgi:Carboxypeptidase regulatory-like domain
MRIVTLVVLLLIATTIALGDTPFKGTVTDSSNTPIASAMVLIHWDSAGSTVGLTTNVGMKEDLVTRTKGDGTFKVDLPPGFYDVFVAAMAFSPTCRKIRIKHGQGLEVTLTDERRPTLRGGDGAQDRHNHTQTLISIVARGFLSA